MAYRHKDLSVLAYANGFTLWHYATTLPAAALSAPGAWDEARDLLRPGDLIIATARTPATAALLLVGAVSPDAVSVAPLAATA